MLAASARTYVNRHGVLPGRRAVVFTTNDSAYAAALDLTAAGVDVAAIVDTRPYPGSGPSARGRPVSRSCPDTQSSARKATRKPTRKATRA